jgi:hypothetical protein
MPGSAYIECDWEEDKNSSIEYADVQCLNCENKPADIIYFNKKSEFITVPNNYMIEQQRIWGTVRVPSSLYQGEKSSLNVVGTRGLSELDNTPLSKYNFVNWDQSSDRAKPSFQENQFPSHGNSTKTTKTSLKPGVGPGGEGVDIKHNSYARYLGKLKGSNYSIYPAEIADKAKRGNKIRTFNIINPDDEAVCGCVLNIAPHPQPPPVPCVTRCDFDDCNQDLLVDLNYRMTPYKIEPTPSDTQFSSLSKGRKSGLGSQEIYSATLWETEINQTFFKKTGEFGWALNLWNLDGSAVWRNSFNPPYQYSVNTVIGNFGYYFTLLYELNGQWILGEKNNPGQVGWEIIEDDSWKDGGANGQVDEPRSGLFPTSFSIGNNFNTADNVASSNGAVITFKGENPNYSSTIYLDKTNGEWTVLAAAGNVNITDNCANIKYSAVGDLPNDINPNNIIIHLLQNNSIRGTNRRAQWACCRPQLVNGVIDDFSATYQLSEDDEWRGIDLVRYNGLSVVVASKKTVYKFDLKLNNNGGENFIELDGSSTFTNIVGGDEIIDIGCSKPQEVNESDMVIAVVTLKGDLYVSKGYSEFLKKEYIYKLEGQDDICVKPEWQKVVVSDNGLKITVSGRTPQKQVIINTFSGF